MAEVIYIYGNQYLAFLSLISNGEANDSFIRFEGYSLSMGVQDHSGSLWIASRDFEVRSQFEGMESAHPEGIIKKLPLPSGYEYTVLYVQD